MKFSLSWLKTHLETDASLARITDTLTAIGLELEGVEDRGAALAPFVIAQVIEAVQHPDADRLRICTVDTGGGVVSVVCGAPNARAGMKGVFAPPDSFIPGTGITLKVGKIRGVESAGMLLSAREVGLSDEHDGILDLPADAPVGIAYAAWAKLDDPVIEISVTPNRGDALSVRGVARDLAAAGLGTLLPFAPARVPAAFEHELRWQLDMPEYCSHVLGRAIRNVRNGPSPAWLAQRLTSIGLRPINALVDVTNFFTFDLGRPLHVFDVGKVSGNILTLRPGAGESFRALNGRDYVAAPEDCAIADAAGVQSLAGIMGGEATGCGLFTTTVFLEVAWFDPVHVALSGRRHQILSDARSRFERGIDPALMPDAVEAATRLILDICGGEPAQVVAAGTPPAWQRSATMRFERLLGLGGLDVPPDDAVASLNRLGFATESRDAAGVTVAVPPWRNDVAAAIVLDQAPGLDPERARAAAGGCAAVEAECDLVEEVLRLRGLDSVPPVSLPRSAAVPGAILTPRQARTALARRTLAAQGLVECVTFSFMSQAHAALFGAASEDLRLTNPIAADLDQLRPTPVATLAEAVGRNAARGNPDIELFEIGPAFAPNFESSQTSVAAGLRAGGTPRLWNGSGRAVEAMDAKADLWAAMSAIGLPLEALSITADAPGFYHPGRSGVVRQGPKMVIGRFGELHPGVIAALDLAGPIVAFELFLDAVAEPKRRRKAALELSAFQPVRRDFAFLADADTPADAILRAIRGAERNLVAHVTLFDVYEGDKLPAGKKSLAFEIVFQPREQTMIDAEIEAASAKIVAAVAKATGAALRG